MTPNPIKSDFIAAIATLIMTEAIVTVKIGGGDVTVGPYQEAVSGPDPGYRALDRQGRDLGRFDSAFDAAHWIHEQSQQIN